MIDDILEFMGSLVLCVVFQIYRYKFRKNIMQYDEFSITPGDYTIEVIGLPSDIDLGQETNLKDFIKNFFEKELSK